MAGKKAVKRGRIERAAPTLSGVAGASGRVLVVDDNKVIRQLIRVNLELEGFEVVTAADGAECLEIVHSVRPDVITLDVVMPRLDGVRTASRLRADPRTRRIAIVMVSAGGLPAGISRPGTVDAFVAKPFEPEALVETVRRLLPREAGPPAAEPSADPPPSPPGTIPPPPPTADPDRTRSRIPKDSFRQLVLSQAARLSLPLAASRRGRCWFRARSVLSARSVLPASRRGRRRRRDASHVTKPARPTTPRLA